MASKNLFAKKIDPLVIKAIESYRRTFTKAQIVDKVSANTHVSRMLVRAYQLDPSWDINLIVIRAIRARVDAELGRRRKNAKLGVTLRVYENYSLDGKGQRRWQKFDYMGMAELQLCLDWRRSNIIANENVALAYQKVIDLMIVGEYETVGEALAS